MNATSRSFLNAGVRRILLLVLSAAMVLVWGGCATPQSRAQQYPEAMEGLSPEERAKVEAGEVDLGFTEEMVLVALGEPDRRYTASTTEGESEIWAYYEGHGRTGFSVGVGTGIGMGRGTVYGGGVSVGTGGNLRPDEWARVVFQGGRVVGFERRQ